MDEVSLQTFILGYFERRSKGELNADYALAASYWLGLCERNFEAGETAQAVLGLLFSKLIAYSEEYIK